MMDENEDKRYVVVYSEGRMDSDYDNRSYYVITGVYTKYFYDIKTLIKVVKGLSQKAKKAYEEDEIFYDYDVSFHYIGSHTMRLSLSDIMAGYYD